MDREPAPLGELSELELLFSENAVGRLTSAIAAAGDALQLAAAARDVRGFAAELVAHGVGARQITDMLSHLNDRLTRRLLDIHAGEEGLDLRRACWLVFGSEGRGEQTIVTDQDNGLVFASTEPARDRDRWLALGRRVNDSLGECGYPRCKGLVMAGNPACCLTPGEWSDRIAGWIEHGAPEDLLKACIYFDLRPVAGDGELARPLQVLVARRAREVPRFLKQMADNALRNPAPLGWLGAVETRKVDGRCMFDLKHHGTMQFVDAARIYALAHGVADTGTRQRFEAIAAVQRVPAHESGAWVRGFEFLQMLRLRSQAAGAANLVDMASLDDIDRRMLKETLRVAQRLQQRLQLDYQR